MPPLCIADFISSEPNQVRVFATVGSIPRNQNLIRVIGVRNTLPFIIAVDARLCSCALRYLRQSHTKTRATYKYKYILPHIAELQFNC
jgi:hypothetical protein